MFYTPCIIGIDKQVYDTRILIGHEKHDFFRTPAVGTAERKSDRMNCSLVHDLRESTKFYASQKPIRSQLKAFIKR